MLGLVESLIAISIIAMTCQIAGRIPAMIMTAFAAVSSAILMPPFASWEIDNTTDLVAVLFQTLVGLTVIYKWPNKNSYRQPVIPSFGHPRNPGFSLHIIVQTVMRRNKELAAKINHIQVCGDLQGPVAISADDLERIVSDVMSMAFSEPEIRHAKVYTARRPTVDEISLVTEYDDGVSLPRVRILGWPDHHLGGAASGPGPGRRSPGYPDAARDRPTGRR